MLPGNIYEALRQQRKKWKIKTTRSANKDSQGPSTRIQKVKPVFHNLYKTERWKLVRMRKADSDHKVTLRCFSE